MAVRRATRKTQHRGATKKPSTAKQRKNPAARSNEKIQHRGETKKSSTVSRKKEPEHSPWDYNCKEELPTTYKWRKVDVPNAREVFRWNDYQKCDIVEIEVMGPSQYGLIVRAFDDDEEGIQCVIAWIYARKDAEKLSFYGWPCGIKYLFSNHFQLIDSKCFIGRAPSIVRKALFAKNNYYQGIDFSSRKVINFENTGNCIVEARRSVTLSVGMPFELWYMVFRHISNSEDSKEDTVEVERTGPNSRSSWGLRYADPVLRLLYDQEYERQANRLARKSQENH
jgi:hypothetical protein